MANEGGNRIGEDDMLVVARLRSTVDRGRTDSGADFAIGSESPGTSEGRWLTDAVVAKVD